MSGTEKKSISERLRESFELPNQVIEAVPDPVITVLTKTYQHGPFIAECIEGVLSQRTSYPFEFIIGEDCSTDGTRETVFEFARRYPKVIRVVTADYNVGSKANGRRCNLRNRGKYTAYCEGDDYWTDQNKLERQVAIMEKEARYSVCFHNALVVDSRGKRKPYRFGKYDKSEYTIEDVILRPWFVPTQSVVIRNSIRDRVDWGQYVYNGDLCLLLRAALRGPFRYVDDVMSVYRRHPQSMSATKPQYYSKQKIIQLLHYFDMYSEFRHHTVIEKRIAELHGSQYREYLYERPWWARALALDYYLFKLQGATRRLHARREGHRS